MLALAQYLHIACERAIVQSYARDVRLPAVVCFARRQHLMGKRRADASSRRFFDEFPHVKVSRFRAMGVIDPARSTALIPFPDGSTKLIGVRHVLFPSGGSWALFTCPGCGRRASKLWLVGDGAPRCVKCCNAMNIKRRSEYGFGRDARRRASDKRLDEIIAKLETNEPLRFKPAPASWGGKAQLVYRSQRLTNAMRRSMVSLRLNQIAAQHEGAGLKSYEPFAAAKQLIDVRPIWRANTSERLQQALDKAQMTIIAALKSSDPKTRLNAAKLMLRTKQARDRGL
jgi:hypothetical protein